VAMTALTMSRMAFLETVLGAGLLTALLALYFWRRKSGSSSVAVEATPSAP